MRYYVFYEDHYAEDGGVGLKEFDAQESALEFIEQRLQRPDLAYNKSLDNYTLIRGDKVELQAVEVTTRVEVV